MAEPNWKKIKSEYIRTKIGYRKLAEKYGVPASTVARRMKEEKWTELRKQSDSKANAKIVESAASKKAKDVERINTVADLLLDKIEEKTKAGDFIVEAKDIKSLTAALKDLRDIKISRTDLDDEEQKARIAKLRKDIEDDKKDNTIQIVIGGDAEDYAG